MVPKRILFETQCIGLAFVRVFKEIKNPRDLFLKIQLSVPIYFFLVSIIDLFETGLLYLLVILLII